MKELGDKLRAVRLENKMTLDDLSRLSGVSKSQLSQIERGLSVPTVTRLQKIADTLDLPISSMFAENNAFSGDAYTKKREVPSNRISVVRKNRRKKLIMPWGAWYEMLCPNFQRNIEFIYLNYPAGTKTGGFYAHEGEECGIVLEGTFKGVIGDEEIILKPGDSIYYDSSIPHTWEAIGDNDVKAIWAITPPSF